MKAVRESREHEVVERGKYAPHPKGESAPRVAMTVDELIPVRDLGPWPEGFTVSREQIYEERA